MVDSLRVGTIQFEHLEIAELSAASSEALQGLDGYLGIGLLRHYLVHVDYRNKRISLYRSGDSSSYLEACGKDSFKIVLRSGVMQSTVVTNLGPRNFQWDTGSSASVVRPSVVNVTTSSPNPQTMFSFDDLTLGRSSLGRIVFTLREFKAPNVDGVLGSDFLEGRSLCFDVPAEKGSLQ